MRFPKSLMLAAGILLAGTFAASARPAVVTTDLNIRSGPGTRYAVIGSLPAGARVNVGSCSSGWCRVGGGFASARYLSGTARTRVVVQPDYYYDDGPNVGLGVLALGVGSGWGYGPGWGYYGPGWGYGGYWGGRPGWRGPGWGGPGRYGWNRPGRPGWNAGWNGRPGRPGPGWNAPNRGGWQGTPFRAGGFRGGGPGMGGRNVVFRPGGGGFRGGRF